MLLRELFLSYHNWQKAEARAAQRQSEGMNSIKEWEYEELKRMIFEQNLAIMQSDLDKLSSK